MGLASTARLRAKAAKKAPRAAITINGRIFMSAVYGWLIRSFSPRIQQFAPLIPGAALRRFLIIRRMAEAKKRHQTIDEYVASFPPEVRKILQQVREVIRESAPGAVETISYQIPTFQLDGTYLVYFAGWKNHISLYPVPAGTGEFAERLAPYQTGKGTVKFPLKEPIPFDLVREIVRFRIQEAEGKANRTKPGSNNADRGSKA